VKGIVEREAVAEYAVALLMAASRLLPQGSQAVKNSQWARRSHMVGMELRGKTIGIIGLGNIGSRSAEILSNGFNANIIASDPYIDKERFRQFNATDVSLEELIIRSNAILFHCPLTNETKRMLGKAQFDAMQKSAVIVNTCRGELVAEDDLYEALQHGPLGAYATDVVEGEPIDGNHRLAKLNNTIITPHLGSATEETRRRCVAVTEGWDLCRKCCSWPDSSVYYNYSRYHNCMSSDLVRLVQIGGQEDHQHDLQDLRRLEGEAEDAEP
jgi:phosphoglycerate dehydrogenase-like enzyme